jgi:ribose-phosphate pyrophosphokinase
MKLISGNGNRQLAGDIADYLDVPLTNAKITRFSDMEVFAEIKENVRGQDVFIIQPTCYPANDNLMELLITIDAVRRGSARRITAVIPYFGYARQDRKTGGRTPISAKLVANLITAAGADRVVTLELHAGQIQGFFDIPLDNLIIAPVFIPEIEKRFKNKELVLVSPDVGGVVRTRALAKRLNADLAIIDKRREKAGVSEVMHVIGNVKDKSCIMVLTILSIQVEPCVMQLQHSKVRVRLMFMLMLCMACFQEVL